MTWTPTAAQERAMQAAREWDRGAPLLILGAAGTGKTSLARHIAADLDCTPAYLAPTGKAARVLRGKVADADHVSTIHSALYAPYISDPDRYAEVIKALHATEDPREIRNLKDELRSISSPRFACQDKFVWQRGEDRRHDIDLLVVDEVSMVGEKIGGELVQVARDSDLPVIAVGDFNQLQPVAERRYFGNGAAHVPAPPLDIVVRQAEGSAILGLAGQILAGKVPRRKSSSAELDLWPSSVDLWSYDMILVGRNATRHHINSAMRREQGFRGPPVPGEPMIVLRNDNALGICNGDIFTVEGYSIDGKHEFITGEFEGGQRLTFAVTLDGPRGVDPLAAMDATPIAYAYAITTHKGQGSEWPSVLVIDESGCFQGEAASWLYTAVTRAKRHLTLAAPRVVA